MKVLQIANGFFGNKLYINLFNNLYDMNVEINIFSPQRINSKLSIDKNEIKFPKQYIYSPELFTNTDRFFFFKKEKKILNQALNYYKECINDFDVIHAHTLFSNGYIAYKLNEIYNIPYIVAVRNTDINVFFKYRINLRSIGNKILKNAKKIIFLSDVTRKYTFDRFIDKNIKNDLYNKVEIIPNGVNEFWINNRVKIAKILKKDKVTLIYVGEINSNKNVISTIKACKELIKNNFDIKYIVVGRCSNNLYKNILNENFIEYHEFCDKKELINYYRNAHIFVMPSKKETFGIVYAEALTQGLPLIYTKGQGFDGQFEDGFIGYCVDATNISDIKKSILKVIDNYSKLSKNVVDINLKFNWEQISARYYKLYEDIANEKNLSY